MNKISAISSLAIRLAIRLRLIISLIVLLIIVIVGFPLTVKGDGTIAGEIKVLIYYTLSMAMIIMGVATIWMSCSAVSREIKEKQIHLIAVKPISCFKIWFGKWSAMLIINTLLLCIVGVTVYLTVQWKIRTSKATEEELRNLNNELLVGRMLVSAYPEAIDGEVEKRVEQLIKEKKVPSDVSYDEVFSFVKKRVLAVRSTVVPGGVKQWIFNIPQGSRLKRLISDGSSAPGYIRFNFASSFRNRKTVSGIWRIGVVGTPDMFTFAMKDILDGPHQFSLPGNIVKRGRSLIVSFSNAEKEKSNTVVFYGDTPVTLLIRDSSFELNLFRSLIIILCFLSLLSALGLTVGIFFSFPVAVFTTISLLAISLIGHYFTASLSVLPVHQHGNSAKEQKHSLVNIIGRKIIKQVDVVVAPASRFTPLESLSNGILVSWKETGGAILFLIVVYSGVLWLLGGYALRQKELALPI